MTFLNPPGIPLVVAAWLGVALLIQAGGAASLGAAEPELQSIYPASCRRGESVQVTLAGTGVDAGGRLFFSRPGVSGEHLQGNQYRLSVSPDATPGDCDVWLATASGLAGPRRLAIHELAVVVEDEQAEDNGTLESALPVPLPVCVEARCDRVADVDWFAFQGRQDMILTVACQSASLDGSAQPVFALIGPHGEELAHSGWEHPEPQLTCALPESGTYRLRVHQRDYRSDAYSQYRLRLTTGPHVLGLRICEPADGDQARVGLLGYGLPGATQLEEAASSGRHVSDNLRVPLQRAELPAGWESAVEDAAAADVQPLAAFSSAWPAPAAAIELAGVRLRMAGVSGEVLVRPFHPGRDGHPGGDVVHREREDERSSPQLLPMPARARGCLSHRGDVDWYRFPARKGDRLRLEAIGERLGQWMDLELVVQDDQGKTLATFSDTVAPKGLPATLPIGTLDPQGEWDVPADGSYRLAVRDLYGSSVYGPDRSYELIVEPQRPRFLVVALAGGDKPGRGIQAGPGKTATIPLVLVRQGGFTGPVTVRLAQPVQGLQVEPLDFQPNELEKSLTVQVLPDATVGVRRVELVATAPADTLGKTGEATGADGGKQAGDGGSQAGDGESQAGDGESQAGDGEQAGAGSRSEPVRPASLVRPGVIRRLDELILSVGP